mmetsp:Transcript_40327/g.79653  ORF Transcript_40327/g.79653 Transcript_40327/m.79653 type:complete len:121 (-) Transcript_40327:274-636(-)
MLFKDCSKTTKPAVHRGDTGASPSDAIAMVILLCDAIIVASPLVQHVTTKTLVRGFPKSVFSDKKSAAECILAQQRGYNIASSQLVSMETIASLTTRWSHMQYQPCIKVRTVAAEGPGRP